MSINWQQNTCLTNNFAYAEPWIYEDPLYLNENNTTEWHISKNVSFCVTSDIGFADNTHGTLFYRLQMQKSFCTCSGITPK